jgi:hypothetical protein
MGNHTRHGSAQSGAAAQEGWAMARAGCTEPVLDGDELAYIRGAITPHLDAADRATLVACVFGDAAARAGGYPQHGLTERAGRRWHYTTSDTARRRAWRNVGMNEEAM